MLTILRIQYVFRSDMRDDEQLTFMKIFPERPLFTSKFFYHQEHTLISLYEEIL